MPSLPKNLMEKSTGSTHLLGQWRVDRSTSTSALGQMVRCGPVGVLINLLGFLITFHLQLWLDPKFAVTLLYPIGAFLGMLNSRFSFNYSGSHLSGLLRYVVAHIVGMLLIF